MNILLDGYLDRNFGDDMLMRLTAYYFPEHRFYIQTPQKELLLPFRAVENVLDYELEPPEKLDFALTVIGSGFILRRIQSLYTFMRRERQRRKLTRGIPTAVIGCSIGPFSSGIPERRLLDKLRSYNFITVREQYSADYLRQNRIACACYPDIAFTLPDGWIPEASGEACLGISAYRREGMDNLPLYRAMSAAADTFIRRTGNRVLLFALDLGRENDLSAAYTIRSLSDFPEQMEIIPHDDCGGHVIAGLRRCGCLIAVRLHMAVMALRLGIPFVPVAYSQKTWNLLRDLNYPGEIFSVDSIAEKALDEAVRTAQTFPVSRDYLEAAQGHFIKVRELLQSQG